MYFKTCSYIEYYLICEGQIVSEIIFLLGNHYFQMYPPSYFNLLVALLLIESTHGCSIDCGDDCACVAPEGLGSDCSGFRGCHKECPAGTTILGCARTLANHTGNEKLLINRTTVSF